MYELDEERVYVKNISLFIALIAFYNRHLNAFLEDRSEGQLQHRDALLLVVFDRKHQYTD